MDLKNLKEELKTFIETLGYQLYDVEFKKKKKSGILTIYIDHDDGITIDNVVEVTKAVNPFIDKLDPIVEEYFLEVSSAGVEKELRTLSSIRKSLGKFVHIETDEEKIQGTLKEFNDTEITLQVNNKTIKINYEDVNLIRLAIKF